MTRHISYVCPVCAASMIESDEALLRQALEALERMVRTTGDTLEIPGVTHPSLTAARAAIAALRERLGEKA